MGVAHFDQLTAVNFLGALELPFEDNVQVLVGLPLSAGNCVRRYCGLEVATSLPIFTYWRKLLHHFYTTEDAMRCNDVQAIEEKPACLCRIRNPVQEPETLLLSFGDR